MQLAQAGAVATLALLVAPAARCATVNYEIDPSHTYPSFEADHMGLSVWRGKFDKTAGKIALDKLAGQGAVDLIVNLDSVDFGMAQMNSVAKGQDMFDVERFPYARYQGQLTDFVNGAPTRLVGELNLHGVTRPVSLAINSFNCKPHPLFKREVCGADALATIDREAFGITAGKAFGFKMDVTLRIQVEAIQAE